MKFRKKPVVVEAVRWFEPGDHPLVESHPQFPGAGLIRGKDQYGDKLVNPGDWVVTGIHGCNYPVRPDVFRDLYEAVDEPTS